MNSSSQKLLKKIVKEQVELINEQSFSMIDATKQQQMLNKPWTGKAGDSNATVAFNLLKSWGATPKQGPSLGSSALELKLPWFWAPISAKNTTQGKGGSRPQAGSSTSPGSSTFQPGMLKSSGDVLTFIRDGAELRSKNHPLTNIKWKLKSNSTFEMWSGGTMLGTIKKGNAKPGEAEFIPSKQAALKKKEMDQAAQYWDAKNKKVRNDAIWDKVQELVDILGFIPFWGDLADMVNAGWYIQRNKYIDAALSLIGPTIHSNQ